jgi:uncharacterized protein (TIGR02118 family)
VGHTERNGHTNGTSLTVSSIQLKSLKGRSMAKLVVLYPQPTDTAQFDKAYAEEHVPLCQAKLKGMKLAVTSIKAAVGGESPYYLMAEVWAPSIEALQQFLGSPDGQEVAGNAFAISTGGDPIVMFSEEEVHEL